MISTGELAGAATSITDAVSFENRCCAKEGVLEAKV
jgi:hypothetical protein